jgi:hypothetical protein
MTARFIGIIAGVGVAAIVVSQIPVVADTLCPDRDARERSSSLSQAGPVEQVAHAPHVVPTIERGRTEDRPEPPEEVLDPSDTAEPAEGNETSQIEPAEVELDAEAEADDVIDVADEVELDEQAEIELDEEAEVELDEEAEVEPVDETEADEAEPVDETEAVQGAPVDVEGPGPAPVDPPAMPPSPFQAPPAQEPSAPASCYVSGRDQTGLLASQLSELCEGAPTPDGPVQCYLSAETENIGVEAQRLTLCRCAVSTEPVDCFVRMRSETELFDYQIERLCSPQDVYGLLPNCLPRGN